MILLNKFISFRDNYCGGCRRQTTYGAYVFDITAYGSWFQFSYKNRWKTFVNCEYHRERRLATFRVGFNMIFLNQTKLVLTNTREFRHCSKYLRINDVHGGLNSVSYKEFIREYIRARCY